MNRVAKGILIEKIKSVFFTEGVILLRSVFLSAEDVVAIKKRLWPCGVSFMFIKNSLARIVANEKNFDFLLQDFSGTVVAFYSSDLFSLIKSVGDVVADYPDSLVLLSGKYMNDAISVEFIRNCSSVSSMQSLYVQLLLTILSPIKKLNVVLKKPIADCSKCLKISVDKQSKV